MHQPPPHGGPAGWQGPGTHGPDPTSPALASWGQRCGARLIDVLIAQIIALVAMIPVMVVGVLVIGPALGGEAVMALILALFFLIYWGYEVVCFRRFGGTIGKRALNLRVVRAGDGADGSEPSQRAVLVRAAVWAAPLLVSWGVVVNLLSGVFWLVNVLWPLWDQPNRQALHDKAAGTVVVRR